MSLDTLTSNEREILKLLAQGKGPKEVARHIGVTKCSLDWTCKVIRRKTGKNILATCVMAAKAGIV